LLRSQNDRRKSKAIHAANSTGEILTVPSRQIDFDAIWTSNKLAACKEENRVEYVWFYGLADANGCFEINVPAIHSKLSVIRPKLYVPRILRILEDFHNHGLLFLWITTEQYGFWTGSEVKGRLPPVSLRSRYRTHCPPVPRKELREYESRHSLERVRIISGQGLGLIVRSMVEPKSKTSDAPTTRVVSPTPDSNGNHKTNQNPEPKAPLLPQQIEYSNVKKLIPEALAIIGRAKGVGGNGRNGDAREELKAWAAKHNIPFGPDSISKALDVAEEKAKVAK
jgi:hypothetical protein